MYSLLNMVLLDDTFSTVSRVTQMEIISKSYAPWSWHTTSQTQSLQINFGISFSRVMFRLCPSLRHAIVFLYYFVPSLYHSNSLLRGPNRKVTPLGSWHTNYHFVVHNNIVVSYFKFMFIVHHSQRSDVGPFHYSNPWQYLTNYLLINPKWRSYAKVKPLWIWCTNLPL